ncbi:hypothetical protein DRQ53_10025 [bacterium]|nr:MAG: hypothetical protein DRQ53_10025 [bacterium]
MLIILTWRHDNWNIIVRSIYRIISIKVIYMDRCINIHHITVQERLHLNHNVIARLNASECVCTSSDRLRCHNCGTVSHSVIVRVCKQLNSNERHCHPYIIDHKTAYRSDVWIFDKVIVLIILTRLQRHWNIVIRTFTRIITIKVSGIY